MMKKLVLVCVLAFAIAGSASALPNYLWNLNGSDSFGSSSGGQVRLGMSTFSQIEQDFNLASAGAYVSVVGFSGELGPSMVKTNLYGTYRTLAPTDSHEYILQVNGGGDWVSGAMDVRIWAGTTATSKPGGTWYLYKLFDPVQGGWATEPQLLGQVPIQSTVGTLAAPWFKTTLASYKTSTPYVAGNGYILSFRDSVIPPIPEPGSMVAMLSGIVGLVGFGIRRRK
jgi:hypothetical protein